MSLQKVIPLNKVQIKVFARSLDNNYIKKQEYKNNDLVRLCTVNHFDMFYVFT